MLLFKEWLSTDPRILTPYVDHRIKTRMGEISNEYLRTDYHEAMKALEDIIHRANQDNLPQILRRAMRHWETTRDYMRQKAARDKEYATELTKTNIDNDLWIFVEALEDMLNGKMPKLERLL